MKFEWDQNKAARNFSKHGVSFTERKDSIRIISTREVTRAEREAYEEG
jgi:uncharacterized DUF497 family protein